MIDPYVGPESQPPPEPEVTDFASLIHAPPEPSALPEIHATQRTDFTALQTGAATRSQVIVNDTPADHLVNFLTPCLIFVLTNVVLSFSLNVRFIYTSVMDGNLRFFAVAFVLGVVALNRVIARRGSSESFIYIFGLFFAVGFYTLVTTRTYEVGSVGRYFLNDSVAAALLFNLSVVAAIWWMVNRLTHECCVDESAVAGDIGIFTATAKKWQWALHRAAADPADLRSPARKAVEVNEPWHQIGDYDPVEPGEKTVPQAQPKRRDYTQRLPDKHPGMALFYFSIPVMTIFVLGLRVIQHAGMPAVRMGAYYMAIYTFCVLFLLCLTSLRQLRAYFSVRGVSMPNGLAWVWMGAGLAMVVVIMWLAASLPQPPLPPAVYVDEQQIDPYDPRPKRLQLLDITPPTMSVMEKYRVRERLETTARVVVAVTVLYTLLKAAGYAVTMALARKGALPSPIARLITSVAWLLLKLLPALSRWAFPRRRIRIQRSIALSSRYDSPFAHPGGQRLSTRDHVAYAYDALRALATDIGAPPGVSQTPFEFLEKYPEGLRSMREEAEELIRLYVVAAYSDMEMSGRIEDRLRKFWLAFRMSRNRYVR